MSHEEEQRRNAAANVERKRRREHLEQLVKAENVSTNGAAAWLGSGDDGVEKVGEEFVPQGAWAMSVVIGPCPEVAYVYCTEDSELPTKKDVVRLPLLEPEAVRFLHAALRESMRAEDLAEQAYRSRA